MGRCKFGYVQQRVKIRSRSKNDTDIAEMMLESDFVSIPL